MVGKIAHTISNVKLCLKSCDSNKTSRKIELSLTMVDAELNLTLSFINIEITSAIAKFDKFVNGLIFLKKKVFKLCAPKKNNQSKYNDIIKKKHNAPLINIHFFIRKFSRC